MYQGLYLNVPFYDDFVHFLGGVWIGGIILLILEKTGVFLEIKSSNKFGLAIGVMGLALIIGLGWEIFEWCLARYAESLGTSVNLQPSIKDTLGDMVMDGLGAGLAALISKK
jgi:hypothetical protein